MNLYFAPLQGYTNFEHRNIFNKYIKGVDAYFTPFLRVEKGCIRNKDIKDIVPENNNDLNLIPQILPKNAEEATSLMNEIVKNNYSSVNINFACPFSMVTKSGRGAALLKNVDNVKEILDAVSLFDIKISVKTRLGLQESTELLELLSILNSYDLEYLIIHPRTANQQYNGLVDIDVFTQIYENSKNPIVYNGDILDFDDYEKISHNYSKLHAIMIGRGLLYNPFLVSEIQGNKVSVDEQRKILESIVNDLYIYYSNNLFGDSHISTKLKSYFTYFLANTNTKYTKKINRLNSSEKIMTFAKLLINEFCQNKK